LKSDCLRTTLLIVCPQTENSLSRTYSICCAFAVAQLTNTDGMRCTECIIFLLRARGHVKMSPTHRDFTRTAQIAANIRFGVSCLRACDGETRAALNNSLLFCASDATSAAAVRAFKGHVARRFRCRLITSICWRFPFCREIQFLFTLSGAALMSGIYQVCRPWVSSSGRKLKCGDTFSARWKGA
jgi:hypothetical protein